MVKTRYTKIILISIGITILVFVAGLFLGLGLDDVRISELINNLNQNELNSESYLVEKDFVATFGGDKCDLSEPRVDALSRELAKLGQLLDKYESSNIFKEDEFNYLKRRYFLLEIKTYTLLLDLKEECEYNFNTILFFYDTEHRDSTRQGYILDSLVEGDKNLYIFSFDRLFEDDPALKTIKLHYNVEYSPTLIINNEMKKEGLTNLEELKNIL